ncbi:hypothetical protein HWV62_28306 [Athelia sp. TMB]|nr:hypothetical protein HWV62_28306 [Athelia sp. TMB]
MTSASGVLLPFQAVYGGKTAVLCPGPSAKNYEKAKAASVQFEHSGNKTYWSTHKTMHDLVDNIIAPYFERQKKALNLPPSQKAIWQIDVWSAHKSQAFCDWMKKNHPNIIMYYVPAGCTGVFQPCDVGIQHIMKHSFAQSCHCDIVEEVLAQVDRGVADITVSKAVGVLHNHTVTWLWEAYKTLNKLEIVQKAHKKILNLHQTDPKFWEELTAGRTEEPVVGEEVEEDDMEREAAKLDDSAIEGDDIIENVVSGKVPAGAVVKPDGLGLVRAAVVESIEYTEETSVDKERPEWADNRAPGGSTRGAGKRKVTANKLYTKFWHH